MHVDVRQHPAIGSCVPYVRMSDVSALGDVDVVFRRKNFSWNKAKSMMQNETGGRTGDS